MLDFKKYWAYRGKFTVFFCWKNAKHFAMVKQNVRQKMLFSVGWQFQDGSIVIEIQRLIFIYWDFWTNVHKSWPSCIVDSIQRYLFQNRVFCVNGHQYIWHLEIKKKTGQCIGSKLQITEKRPTSYSLRAFDFNIPGGKKPWITFAANSKVKTFGFSMTSKIMMNLWITSKICILEHWLPNPKWTKFVGIPRSALASASFIILTKSVIP